MDYNKIGEFIEAERKAKGLTQTKLAAKIFVSEKTISKWENGKGVPDANSLQKLCEVFDVSLNELMSGERAPESAKQQNEQLLLSLAKEVEDKNKIIWLSMWVIMIVSMIALLGGVFVCAFLIPEGVWQSVVMVGLVVAFLIPCLYALKLEVCVGAYKCKKCGCKIVPTYTEVLCSMHKGFTRYLKCPNCNKRTWCKKILKK